MRHGMNTPTARKASKAIRVLLDNSQIYDPSVRYLTDVDTLDGPGAHLYLETFVRSTTDDTKWDGAPSESWPLIASLTPSCIRLYPIHLNPHAQRYLSPQHGVFTSVVYEDNRGQKIPNDARGAISQLKSRLPWGIFKDLSEGFGLKKELTEVVHAISVLTKDAALRIVKAGNSRMGDGEVVVSAADMDSLRRAMNRIDRRKREGVKHAKQVTVFNELLTKLDPARLKRSDGVKTQPLVTPSPATSRRANTLRRQAGEAAISQVRASLPVLAAANPVMLMSLQNEIERVTLAEMILKYEALLGQEMPEGKWQAFFETYQFVLSLAFARPVRLLHTQFHAQSTAVDGSGAQIGDFLLRQTGRGLAIVEIKRPDTELLRRTPYRNTQVFAPSKELSGAITQTLVQQNALRTHWFAHQAKERNLRESGTEYIQCVVIAGKMPIDEHQLTSFEVFRNACKDVEVLTFDELLEKLKYIRNQLNQPAEQLETKLLQQLIPAPVLGQKTADLF